MAVRADATLRIDANTKDASKALGKFKSNLVALASGVVIGGIIAIADEVTNLTNKLKQVTDSTDDTNRTFNDMVQIANNARAPLATVGDLYFRIAKSADLLGISNAEAKSVTETLAKAISISGISAQEASGPLLQLGQALQSGRLQGDEFRSIMEGLPIVMKALSKELNVPIGQLKKMASEGKISARTVIKAMQGAKEGIDETFKGTESTIGQSFTVLMNNIKQFVKVADDATGASAATAATVNQLSDVVTWLSKNFGWMAEKAGQVADAFNFMPILKAAWDALVPTMDNVNGAIQETSTLFGTLSGWIDKVIEKFNTFKNAGSEALGKVSDKIDGVVGSIKDWFGESEKAILGTISGSKSASAAYDAITGGIDTVTDATTKAIAKTKNWALAVPGVQSALDTAKDAATSTIAAIGDGFLFVEQDAQNSYNLIKKIFSAPIAADMSAGSTDTSGTGGSDSSGVDPALQDAFNSAIQKKIELMQAANRELEASISLGAEDFAIWQNIEVATMAAAAAGAEVTSAIRDEVTAAAVLKTDLEAQLALQNEFNASLAEGNELYYALIETADPRLEVEQAYIDQKTALQDAFVSNSLITEDGYQLALQALETGYRTAKFDAELAMQEELTSLREAAIAQELVALGHGHKQAMSMAKNRAAFEKKTGLQKTQFAMQQLGALLGALGTHNKKAFEAAKAFNIANALINTYTGATKALAEYSPPFSFIAAAAQIATGLLQVNTIRSQSFSGKAIGGPVFGSNAYMVGENGPEMFRPQGAGKIISNPALRNEDGEGASVIIENITINTADDESFETSLDNQREMIVSIMRDAMNDVGETADF